MSAAVARPRIADAHAIVVHDPDEPDAARWLVLHPESVDGMPTWTVASRHAARAQAESAAGYHAARPAAWLLRDPTLGWRLAVGHGWTAQPSLRNEFTQLGAAALANREPGLELFVRRMDGRITCPDLERPGETVEDMLA